MTKHSLQKIATPQRLSCTENLKFVHFSPKHPLPTKSRHYPTPKKRPGINRSPGASYCHSSDNLKETASPRIETEAQRLCRQSPTVVPERPLSIPRSATIFHNDNIIHTWWAYFISTKCFKLEIFASVKYHYNIVEIDIVF